MAGADELSAEAVFRDFMGRRAGIVTALTADAEKFYCDCEPDRENLCLYGNPNETWVVALPDEEIPSELPEPALGINFARDLMDPHDWLTMVAAYSDSWLIATAFYYAACLGFNKDGRKELFDMISTIPTVVKIVAGTGKKQTRGRTLKSGNKRNKPGPKTSPQCDAKATTAAPPEQRDDKEDDDEQEDTPCAACGDVFDDEFWICCDLCERWFHGGCVGITPSRARRIKRYVCPICSG